MATEDYFSKSLLFKLAKVARYVELYGFSRTLVKVRAQFHLKASEAFDEDVWQNPQGRHAGTIGIIGCGSFAFGVIGYYLAKRDKGFLKAAMDVSAARARSLVKKYRGAYATTDAAKIIADSDIRLVYIASNHASHAEFAIDAIRAGKHVHIEKPHVVTADQLSRLQQAMQENPTVNVYLGFNRPRSSLFQRLSALISRETGPVMVNWFIAGHQIDPDHWYFSPEEGGRILGNLCHWTDLTLELVPAESRWPMTIHSLPPAGSKSDFITMLTFGDGSQAGITFSAKGHTFEGVREILNLHRGDLLAELKDFKTLSIAHGARRKTWSSFFRDHGHQSNVMHSYNGAMAGQPQLTHDRVHIIDTARLFLAVKESHDTGAPVVLAEGSTAL